MFRSLVRSGSFFAIRKTNRLRNRVAVMFELECTLSCTLDARVVFFWYRSGSRFDGYKWQRGVYGLIKVSGGGQ